MTDAALPNLIAYSAQVLIVIAVGAFSTLLFRLPKARGRVAYWRVVLAMCLALPLLAPATDRIVFVPQSPIEVVGPSAVNTMNVEPQRLPSPALIVTWLLVAGAALRVAWLAIGVLALRRLRRRSDVAVLSDGLDVLRKAIAPAASIRWQARLAQPVAFGWRRPVVLLPRRVADMPPDAQRAVVCHELLHVARRDWLWMLGEETIRSVFWFHPAIWFAVEQLQLSREELVDEEVVRITGVRQPYVRALAMFAGDPTAVVAATPFIRRRHLMSRIRQLSEEHTMSRLRIACGFLILLVVIAASGWVAMAALPLRPQETTTLPVPRVGSPFSASLQSVAPAAPAGGDQPARGHTDAERAATIAYSATFALHGADQARDAQQRAHGDQPLTVHVATPPAIPAVLQRVEPVYPEAAKGHGIEAVVHLRVNVGTAGEVTDVEVIRTRLTMERDVTDPTFWASQPSKLFAQAAEDAVRQWRFEASSASRRFELPVSFAEHHMAFVAIGRDGHGAVHVANGMPAPTRFAPAAAQGDKPARIRVGDPIRPPHLVSKVEPFYPLAAKAAGVHGVVILEIVIGTEGTVKEGVVVRSIPLLDQAALDAVVQWKYEPTLLNGAPAEAIVTVAVNFMN